MSSNIFSKIDTKLKIVERDQLNDTERTFLTALIETGDRDAAAAKAGITVDWAKRLLYQKRSVHFLREHTLKFIAAVIVPKAISRINEMVERGAAPNKTQLDACKTVLDRIGIIAPKATDPDRAEIAPENMSIEDLNKLVAGFQAQLDRFGVPAALDVTPQALDYMD